MADTGCVGLRAEPLSREDRIYLEYSPSKQELTMTETLA